MGPGESRDAAMITVKGRMKSFFEIVCRAENDLLVHLEPGLAEPVLREMQHYVFATRVTLEDVTDGFALVLVLGSEWAEVATGTGIDGLVLHPTSSFGAPGGYVWAAAADHQLLLGRLAEKGLPRLSEDDLEKIRIEVGAPRWGVDMNETTFPQEAGIDGRAVHYQKGCYLGQEAMAKIHFRGKVNRRLARIVGAKDIEPGAAIFVDGAKVGEVTSASGNLALGYVRYTVEPGSTASIGDDEVMIES